MPQVFTLCQTPLLDELLSRGAAGVYATARAPKPSEDPPLASVTLDVTDPDSVAALAICAPDATIVINNAGAIGAPKNDPHQVARDIVDGIERGDREILADDVTRHFKAALSGPVEGLQLR